MVQTAAILVESVPGLLLYAGADTHCGPAADAVVNTIAVEHRCQAEEGQELAVECPGHREIAGGQESVGYTADLHIGFP